MLSIISTVGMSVFHPKPLKEAIDQFEGEESKHEKVLDIIDKKTFPGQEIHKQALADLMAKSRDYLRKASAEINAIEGFHERHNVAKGNHYYFLASDTATGLLAARVLKDFCSEKYKGKSEVKRIQGLQVNDSRKFRLEGLPFLVKTLYELIDDSKRNGLTVLLNPTGGFKAAISYITLIGMIKEVEVGLIHESSQTLITLSGLPIGLKLNEIRLIYDALEKCDKEQQNGIDKNTLKKELGLNRNESIEESPFWSFFEEYDHNHYILSGLGSIALEELRKHDKQQKVWLSKQAWERLEKDFKPGSEARKNFEVILNRIDNPDNRVDPYRHTYKDCKYPAYKYKGNERLFYDDKREDNSILILELAQHIGDNDWSYDRVPNDKDDYQPYKPWERIDK